MPACSGVQGVCLPKGMVRTFKVISTPPKDSGKAQSGPLLSARQCDLDVLWQRAEQLCNVSIQVRYMQPGGSHRGISGLHALASARFFA